jgi:hypothetical protein
MYIDKKYLIVVLKALKAEKYFKQNASKQKATDYLQAKEDLSRDLIEEVRDIDFKFEEEKKPDSPPVTATRTPESESPQVEHKADNEQDNQEELTV